MAHSLPYERMYPLDTATVEKMRSLEEAFEKLGQRVAKLEEVFEQETDELDQRLDAMKQIEVGITNDGVIKGTLEWVSFEALGLTTHADPPQEVIIFKSSITYIRSSDERQKNHGGMYV